MTEKERFKYVRNTYKHYIHDTEKDGEWKEGYIGTYGEFDLDKLTIELNKRENRINHLKNENEQLKRQIGNLEHTRDFVGDVCADCNRLENEVDELKSSLDFCRKNVKRLNDNKKELNDENNELREYNKEMVKDIRELEERNDRQAKQLDRLYKLIEDKDWRALSDIIDDFKRCEEQLQKEWRQYE